MKFLPFRVGKHKGRWLVAGAVGTALLGGAVFGDHGVFHLQGLRAEQRELEAVVFELQQRNHGLRRRIERLRHDDLYLERLARQRLGMARPDEVVYRILPTPVSKPDDPDEQRPSVTDIP